MAKAKKGTRKKVKETKATATTLDAKTLDQALADLTAGTAGIRELGVSLGFSSGAPLRAALREHVGEGKYAEAIAAGRAARGGPGVATISVGSGKNGKKPAKKASGKKAPRRAAKK